MIEAGNIEGAITSLGGEKTSNIVELIKSKKERELKEIDIKILRNSMLNNNLENEELNNLKIKKQNIEIQIKDLNKKYEEMFKNSCTICFNKLISPIFEENCQNMFCGECFLTWINKNNTCPLCRTKIDIKKIVYIKTKEDEINYDIEKVYTKEEKIIDIINKNKKGKFLIFSEYDKSFFLICNILKNNNIKFLEIKGNCNTREKNLELFNNGDINVIFLNSKTNGAGINLQEATDVILYHEMNLYDKNQIIGRANRIGRKVSLNIHNLMIKN
jgi:SNF2 family DNA or RNA helicase